MQGTKLKAFVLMPLEPKFTSIYEKIIKPALEEAGYEVSRADSILDQHNILHDIVKGIVNAHLIVADITKNNPNVLYELGLCHGLKIPTVLLAQSIEEVPFDLRSYRIKLYSTRFNKIDELKEYLKEIGKKHSNGNITFSSPITDFFLEKLKIENGEIKILSEEKVAKEKGFRDYILEANMSVKVISVILEKVKTYSDNIKNLDKKRMNVVELQKYCENMEAAIPKLSKHIAIYSESVSNIIILFKVGSEQDAIRLMNIRKTTVQLYGVSIKGIEDFIKITKNLKSIRDIEANKDVRLVSKRVENVFHSLIEISKIFEAFCIRSIYLIDTKLKNSRS